MMRHARFCSLVVACALVALALAPPAARSATKWIEYRPDKVGFAIDMPGPWQETSQTQKIDDVDVKSVSVDVSAGGNGYMVTYVVFPEPLIRGRATSEIVDNSIEGAVAAANGILRKDESIMIGGLPARQIIVDAPGNVVLVGRVIMFADTIVEVDVGGKKGVESDPTVIQFLSSLKVVGR